MAVLLMAFFVIMLMSAKTDMPKFNAFASVMRETFGRVPLDPGLAAPSPFREPLGAEPHLRWHPLRGEWVTYAAYRQGRTYLPPPQYNPLAPTRDPAHPTEVPEGDWEVAVFDNRFPSLAAMPPEAVLPDLPVPCAGADGACEVVVFTQDPASSLGMLPLDHLDLLLQVWGDRVLRLGSQARIAYVLPFENRGAEAARVVRLGLPQPQEQPHGRTGWIHQSRKSRKCTWG